jgi:predicted MFS family arabinose efflux permease
MGPPETSGRTLAVVVAGLSSAIVLGVLLGVLIGQYMGWRGTLIFVAAVSGLAAVAIMCTQTPEAADNQPRTSLPDQVATTW